MKKDEFKCSVCKQIFESAWSEEEAEEELKKNFGVPKEDCDAVCDDCYRNIITFHLHEVAKKLNELK